MAIGVHAAAPPRCIYASDCAPRRGIIYRCEFRARRMVRLCVLAYACDRVRALTMRLCAACVRLRHAHFVTPSMEYAHTQCTYTQCMHVSISMRVWLPRRMDHRCGPAAHTCPWAASVRARVCARAHGRPRVCTETCEPFLPASTAGGSARRPSLRRRRSTRTSARGTPPRSPRCKTYARPPRAGQRATAGGTRSAGCSMRRGPLCAAGPPMRACVWAQTCGRAHARASACVGTAAGMKDGIRACMYGYMHLSNWCVHYKYIYIGICVLACVRDGYRRACGCTACTAHVRAIACAEDAAVAITCARGYVRLDI
jgi:hypothetical protein